MNKILSIFDRYPDLVIGFSTKSDGNMRLKPSDSIKIDIQAKKNRRIFLDSLGINEKSVVDPILEHGTNILIVNDIDGGKTFKNVDALITARPGIFLNLTVADCLSIFLYDHDKKVIALVHAGWRGLQDKIIENVLAKLKEFYNSDPSSIIVGIGPHIGGCHYEIQDDVSEKFREYPDAFINKEGHKFFDIGIVAETQLTNLGFRSENIEVNSECTFELTDKYFSFRRDKPRIIETMLAVFGMK